jgi:murein DD-endopeptidase MepM/ murein hydrolase activator NlpD
MIYPFKGTYVVSRPFGVYDPAYANYPDSLHPGTDWALPHSTPLFATMDGVVTIYDRDPNLKIGRGKEVSIVQDNVKVNTCHMSRIDVRSGQTVKEGKQIGLSGNTGYSDGPHLHAELIINNRYVNFDKYLKETIVEPKDYRVNWGDIQNAKNALGLPINEGDKGFIGMPFKEFYTALLIKGAEWRARKVSMDTDAAQKLIEIKKLLGV